MYDFYEILCSLLYFCLRTFIDVHSQSVQGIGAMFNRDCCVTSSKLSSNMRIRHVCRKIIGRIFYCEVNINE